METGLEVLLKENLSKVKGKVIGIITNQTGIDSHLNHIVDLLLDLKGIKVAALFAPEHGIWGTLQDQVSTEGMIDPRTGLRCFSLYGSSFDSLSPTREMLDHLDILIFDIQDIGTRYYTFIHTMALCMEASYKYGKKMLILDRPNPIGGVIVEGNILKEKFKSFVGLYPIPVRHGMTVGELALLFKNEFNLKCDLEVIPMQGWKRSLWFDDTELPWISPSPNIPTLNTALVYSGSCLIEGTNISEGRGTTKPFELIGAPFVDPWNLSKELEKEGLPGVKFRPTYFRPTFNKWKGEDCGGIQIHVTNRYSFKSYLTGISLLKKLLALYPGYYKWREDPYEFCEDILAIDMLTGDDEIRKKIEGGFSLEEIELSWMKELETFLKIRKRYLLYS